MLSSSCNKPATNIKNNTRNPIKKAPVNELLTGAFNRDKQSKLFY